MMVLPGCDVSSNNGPPADWMAQAGQIAWLATKITELSDAGPYMNPDAEASWAFAKARGLGRIAYCFAHPSTSPGETARFFTGELSRLGLEDGDGVALDLEQTDGKGPREVSEWGKRVLAELEHELDRVPILYTYLSFADAGNCAGMGAYPLWIADPSSPAGRPRVPQPWKTWVCHQWKITGIDRDVAAFGDLTAMRAQLGRRHVQQPGETRWEADGKLSLIQIAARNKATPAGVLRRTALHDQRYSGPMAAYLNAVFAGTLPATAPVPAGVVLRVPA